MCVRVEKLSTPPPLALFGDSESYESDPSCVGTTISLSIKTCGTDEAFSFLFSQRVKPDTRVGQPGYSRAQKMGFEFPGRLWRGAQG